MRKNEHVTTSISRADLMGSMESDHKKKILRETIQQNIEAILNGQYTNQDLLKNTGLFETIGALNNFLSINFTTSSLKVIAKGLQTTTETHKEQKPPQELVTVTATDIQRMVFEMFDKKLSRRDVNKKLQELIAQQQLPSTIELLKICGKEKNLTSLINNLYSKWELSQTHR